MNKPFHLAMRDFVTFRVSGAEEGKRYLHECKDSSSDSGYSLLVHVDATHSGIVNGNLRFYRPDLMQECTHNWVNPRRAKKPVLTRHDDQTDPLGRVVTAKYVDTRHLYTSKYSKINNLIFYDAVSKARMDLFKSVDYVYNTLQRQNRDFEGLGYISLGLNVTQPEAIAKIQREEYATVSVGFNTDAAICSICHQDWSSKEGRCDHRLGEMVDDKRMFLITGNFDYEELSFVSFPADPFATVKNTEILTKAKDSFGLRVFLLGQAFDEEAGALRQPALSGAALTACADMLEADIRVVPENSQQEEDTEMDLEAVRTELHSRDLTRDRALALRAELKDNADARRLLSSLNAKIKKNGWDTDAAEPPSREEVEIRIAGLSAHVLSLAPADRDAYIAQLTADAALHNLDVPVLDASGARTGTVIPAAGTFRTDARVIALIGGLPCRDSEQGKSFVSKIEDVVTAFRALPEGDHYYARTLLYQVWDVLGDESMIEWYKKRLASDDNATDAIISRAELSELQDAVHIYEQERAQAAAALNALKATNKTLLADRKHAMATAIVMYSVLAGETGFKDLNADQIRREIEDRAKRQLISLQDSLTDLQRKLAVPISAVSQQAQGAAADAAPPAAAAAASAEVQAAEVPDTARLNDQANQPQAGAPAPAAAEPLRGQAVYHAPIATLEDLRRMRIERSSQIYEQLKGSAATV